MKSPKEIAQSLTELPGVYRMINALGRVIYVGKAKNLKSRVSSYFATKQHSSKTLSLVGQIHNIEVTVTSTENEALILEANLIKELRPKYNVLMRDDKSYPFLYLNTTHEYPRLDYFRGTSVKKGKLYGPYPNSGAVRKNLNFLQKVFKLRQCSDVFFAGRKRPCLQYQINRCTAPCVGLVNQQDYSRQVKQVEMYLAGKNDEVVESLRSSMQKLAEVKKYEQAAILRDQIAEIRELTSGQPQSSSECIDLFSPLKASGDLIVVHLMIRQGQVLGHRCYYPDAPSEATPPEVLAAFLMQFYLQPLNQLKGLSRIVITCGIDNKPWIESTLSELMARRIRIVSDQHPKYRSWSEMARRNAINDLSQKQQQHNVFASKLQSLQHALSLSDDIVRVECFDISHTSGQNTSASCVVFDKTGALKKDYRCFNIAGITPGDDYAAMKQALTRRYTSLKKKGVMMPDLLIIDGGKGQLKQAEDVLEELQIHEIVLLGVAKGVSRKPGCETLFLSSRSAPIFFKHDSKELHCIQIIRDEAHRFAITTHRKRRAKQFVASNLELIPGVGRSRRQELLTHFGGWQGVMSASELDLVKVRGISPALAKVIYGFLHKVDP